MKKYNIFKRIIILGLVSIFITGCGTVEKDDAVQTVPKKEQMEEDEGIIKEPIDIEEPNDKIEEPITIIIEDILKGEKELTYQVKNNSESIYYYDAFDTLEKQIDGNWVKVEPTTEFAVISIAYLIEKDGEQSHVMNLEFYDELDYGEYRVAKRFTEETAAGDAESIIVYGEFTVLSINR